MANDGEKHLQAAYERLIEDSIKVQFEKDGTMGKLQSELHVKVLQMLKGQMALSSNDTLSGAGGDYMLSTSNAGLADLLNQLIIEYFNWFGFKHTAETFKMESGVKVATRDELLRQFGHTFNLKELPILVQMLIEEQERGKPKIVKVKQLQSMKQLLPKEEKNLVQHFANDYSAKQTKVARKVIEKPIGKTSIVKQLRPFSVTPHSKGSPLKKPPTKRIDKQNSKYSSDIDSEETDYRSSSDDDLYADIPDRHYYREMEAPETKYPFGFGEEGPYKAKQKEAERLLQKYKKQLPPKPKTTTVKKPKTNRLEKCESSRNSQQLVTCPTTMTGREALELQLNKALNAKAKNLTQGSRSGRNLWAKQRSPPSEIEPDLAVTKPECPDTLISNIQLESDGGSETD